jgi:hypothetical protein
MCSYQLTDLITLRRTNSASTSDNTTAHASSERNDFLADITTLLLRDRCDATGTCPIAFNAQILGKGGLQGKANDNNRAASKSPHGCCHQGRAASREVRQE